jgi:hypothetical protein
MTRPIIRGTRIPRRRSSSAPDGCAGLCRSATLRRAAQTTGRLSRRAGAARRAMRCVPCWPVNTQTLCRAARLLGARLGVPTGGTSTTCKYGNSHSPADRSHEPGDDTAASVTHSGEREFAPVGRLKGPERRLNPRSCQQPAPAEDTDPNTRAAPHRAAVAVLCCCTYCSNRSNYASDQWS